MFYATFKITVCYIFYVNLVTYQPETNILDSRNSLSLSGLKTLASQSRLKCAPCHERYSTFDNNRGSEETFDVTNAHILAASKKPPELISTKKIWF